MGRCLKNIGDDLALHAVAIHFAMFRLNNGIFFTIRNTSFTLTDFPLITKSIQNGDNALIAADAFVPPRINIGESCLISSLFVVNRNKLSRSSFAG